MSAANDSGCGPWRGTTMLMSPLNGHLPSQSCLKSWVFLSTLFNRGIQVLLSRGHAVALTIMPTFPVLHGAWVVRFCPMQEHQGSTPDTWGVGDAARWVLLPALCFQPGIATQQQRGTETFSHNLVIPSLPTPHILLN